MSDIAYRNTVYEIGNDYYAVPQDWAGFLDQDQKIIKLEEDGDGDPIIPDDFVELESDPEESERVLALRLLRDEWNHAVWVSDYEVNCTNKYWLVVTNSEADDLWDQRLDDYIDQCLEIPESIERYFDKEKWKDDARMDGRAISLAPYDHNEETVTVNDTVYYIYRQN